MLQGRAENANDRRPRCMWRLVNGRRNLTLHPIGSTDTVLRQRVVLLQTARSEIPETQKNFNAVHECRKDMPLSQILNRP